MTWQTRVFIWAGGCMRGQLDRDRREEREQRKIRTTASGRDLTRLAKNKQPTYVGPRGMR
jgi:hypothetical protein